MTDHTILIDHRPAARSIKRYVIGAIAALAVGAILGLAAKFVLRAEFKAESTYAVVANSSSGASGLGSLAGLAGLPGLAGAGGGRLNLDQYVALIQNNDTLDSIIERHGLLKLWRLDSAEKARKKLKRLLRIWIGLKDQLIRIEVSMPTAELASNISNELGQLMGNKTSEIASAEAKSRRLAMEPEVRRAQAALEGAQQHLMRTQLDPALARADLKALGERVAKLQGDLGSVETRLAAAASVLASGSAEMKQLVATRDSLRDRLRGFQKSSPSGDFGYMDAFREFKYQEAVLEILMRQYESARIDEIKGGQYIHIVQPARPAERPYFPDPAILVATGALSALLVYGLAAFMQSKRRLRTQR